MNSFRLSRGFSLLEVLVTIAILGIIAVVAVQSASRIRVSAASTKLDSDVNAINQSIKVYLANGGSLDGITDPAAVLRKLKTRRSAAAAAEYAGFRSEMIDQRVVGVMQTAAEASRSAPRAIWNATAKRFEVAQQGAIGVARFELSDVAGKTSYGVENRAAGAIDLNTGNGWIWNYQDAAVPVVGGPTAVPVTPTPPPTPVTPTPPGRLQAPVFSRPGGVYRYDTFPTTLTITNPNSTGEIMVARTWTATGVTWSPYTGAITMQPDSDLLAYVKTTTSEHSDSVASSGTYQLEIIDLQAATITPRSDLLDLDTNESVTIEISNPNPSAYRSQIEYSVGNGFVAYTGPVNVSPSQYSNGFEIAAQVVPTGIGFRSSSPVNRWLSVKLKKPLINTQENKVTKIHTATLFDTNAPGAASLRYAIEDLKSKSRTAWRDYQTPFTIDGKLYRNGFEVVAYAVPKKPRFLDSQESKEKGQSFFGTQVADRSILVLDVSGSMASYGRLDKVKEEAKRLISAMPEDGRVGIITFGRRTAIRYEYQETTASAVSAAQGIIDSLIADGGTPYSTALDMALGVVRSNPDALQVVFLSDGAPNGGDMTTEGILRRVDAIAALGVRVSAIGYEMKKQSERDLIDMMNQRGVPTNR